ncbi:MAG: aminodeoxychorismate/anthranilate synthase component II [Myxococcota bacterium]|nr:aminodeoxychorismate/anthranilate synthase component II [Myxococcota bacterium]
MSLLILDNYDSFTYNLVQYLGELGASTDVVRSDVGTPEEILEAGPEGVVISPGPGRPEDAGNSVRLVQQASEAGIPVLGVCLGHQAIGIAFGGAVVSARTIMHGKTSPILHDDRGLFRGLPEGFEATRYHSLVIDRESCPAVLEVSARTDDGEIMGVRHRSRPVEGVQFHPESILTVEGKSLLGNFLETCRQARNRP